ncbi:MAG TPA: methionine--tRNA ligase [Chloroflexia bacterium]|nr:methionine--tRNA ligase [Chloroflexia bacterium]
MAEENNSNEKSNKPGERILVSVAWPYANGPFHAGHVSGVYLPADIFARFKRAQGKDVLMVSGSDSHGTPITIKAEQEGVSPLDIVNRYHASFLKTFEALGIEFDLFTKTYTENHYAITQDMFLKLLQNGYIYKEKMTGSYSEKQGRFLPDRYVEGVCPVCGNPKARGDQCDNCGTLLDPEQLGNPHSREDGSPITFRETEHYFLDLGKLQPALESWINGQDRSYWRDNTVAYTRNWLERGLHGRAITRDLEWGVPVPVEDPAFKDKRIYVWFDAVIGYYSASHEWAQRLGEPDAWKKWWVLDQDGEAPALGYYFLGKDNITFHTIIWPSILLGYGGLALPYDVPASEFLNLEGEKMSTSQNWALWLPDIEERYQPDQLRYYMTAIAPETRDSNWSWTDFVSRINNELVGTYGNLVNRVLTNVYKNYDGKVPQPGELDDSDRALLAERDAAFARVTEMLEGVHLRDALKEALALASAANRYLDEKSPWKVIKTDKAAAGTTFWVALQVINTLKVLTYPFLPFSAEKLNTLLGFQGALDESSSYSGRTSQGVFATWPTATWAIEEVPAGQALSKPEILFNKLDEKVGEEEKERLLANRR